MWLSSSWDTLWGLTSLNPPPSPNSLDWVINRLPAGKRGASRLWDTEEALIWVDSELSNETLKISERIRWELEWCSQKLLPTDHVFLGAFYIYRFTITSFTSKVWGWDLQKHIFPTVSLLHTLNWCSDDSHSGPLVILQLQCRPIFSDFPGVSLLKLPTYIFAETVSDFVPVRELCFLKNNGIHEHSRRRKSGPLWEQAAASQGIVTRCKGGNTWSIPSCRNVFISLFTNVAISRCVHFKVHCSTGSPSSGAWLQWGTCAGAGLRYLNSWHSLVRHVRMRADLRVLYHTEWEKTQAFSGTDSTLYSVIASNAWSPLAEGSTISTGTRWKADGKVSESNLTLRSCCLVPVSCALWDLGESLKACEKCFLWVCTRSYVRRWRKMPSLWMRLTLSLT